MNSRLNQPASGRFRGVKAVAMALSLAGSAMMLTGCNDAQAGGLLGAGIGALAGQAIGHNTAGTLLGLGIGAGTGYILGNESDKERYQRYGHYDWHDDYYRHYDQYHGNYDY